MSDRATLLSLADEVERLTGPDRGELNWRIAVAIGDIPAPREQPFFRFTNSIDAAAGIMPKGWFVRVQGEAGACWIVEATGPTEGDYAISDVAKSEPLARTAAALRAMAGGVGDDR